MSRKVLIISPHFPPQNAADMQRVRMSLPYFKKFGWEAEVVTVDEAYAEIVTDDLLMQSIPTDIKVHKVKALNRSWTAKVGLGSLALRSMWYYRKKVNSLLKQQKFDLVYFSTTEFPVCVLGAYWKKRFGVPYIIDMQDPWHSEYYQDKQREQQPPKYWFSYRLHKYLEPMAMKSVDGLISVSENYIKVLKSRYPDIKDIPQATITFGAYEPDIAIANANNKKFKSVLKAGTINIAYVGRGGADMQKAVGTLFCALKTAVQTNPQAFNKLRFYFIGTSYAPAGQGLPTIMPVAVECGVQDYVVEVTDRISYYHTLSTLEQADALLIPGSDDPNYTASKLYPYLLTKKPLLTLFNEHSPALKVLDDYGAQFSFTYNQIGVTENIIDFMTRVTTGRIATPVYKQAAIDKYSAENMTKQQCLLFNEVVK